MGAGGEQRDHTMKGTCYSIEVRPGIPARLNRLAELADDLFYGWSSEVRALFYYLHPDLWSRVGHKPKLFLRRVSQRRLDEAARDPLFLQRYDIALVEYDNYLGRPVNAELSQLVDTGRDLVAYLSMEFGFHESLPIYSGGLGILAGDHCKAASDLGLPLVAVGLLYRQGYFDQYIDAFGNQEAHYPEANFADLPISPALGANGNELLVQIGEVPDPITLRVWQVKVGRIRLFLLDSDVEQNSPANRTITHRLYGGDAATRISQEIVLGIGGVRALRAVGLAPTAWHINEGHGAFQVVERCRELTSQGVIFDAALERVAKSTVFTTHTPVEAGHDVFSYELMSHYLGPLTGQLGIGWDDFFALGSSASAQGGFNMTALAFRGSRLHNGVSRIHGGVASEMEGYVWPQIDKDENPVGYVTNGVHVGSFLAPEWRTLFDMEFGHEWRSRLVEQDYWSRIDDIPDYRYWSVRQTLKSQLFKDAIWRIRTRLERLGDSPVDVDQAVRHLSPGNTRTLVLGFARRFATYKRATLIFGDLDRLRRLLNDPQRPVVLMVAGKAHPSDQPGQDLIRTIHQLSQQKEFLGRIILLEDYNMALARRLVAGVDVWLNTPEYPLEASGTSGQKAGLNGVVNLSVLDGWWGECFDGDNGWAIAPHPNRPPQMRDQIESQNLLDILEQEIIPMYFDYDGLGYSKRWVQRSKASMRSILPRFNSQRMVMDYTRDYYRRAIEGGRRLAADDGAPAAALAEWKNRVHQAWPLVSLRRVDRPLPGIAVGERITIEVAARLGALNAADVVMECLIGRATAGNQLQVFQTVPVEPDGRIEDGETFFHLDLTPPLGGLQYYKLRLYPSHPLLTHRFEMGYMLWL